MHIVLVALLALTLGVLADPPHGSPHRPIGGLPPPNPRAIITYANGGGTVELGVDGDYLSVVKECRGLDGTCGLTFVDVLTRNKVTGKRAYSLMLFPEWGCKHGENTPPVLVNFFNNNGEPLQDSAGNVVVPKSYKLVPM